MIKSLRGYVLIEIEKAEEKTASGVYLPENSQEKPAKGKIINVGESNIVIGQDKTMTEGLQFIYQKLEVKKDDIVYFKKWAGTEVKEKGKEYVFVKFEDLLGVIE